MIDVRIFIGVLVLFGLRPGKRLSLIGRGVADVVGALFVVTRVVWEGFGLFQTLVGLSVGVD